MCVHRSHCVAVQRDNVDMAELSIYLCQIQYFMF